MPPSLLTTVASFSFLTYSAAWKESRLRIEAFCQTSESVTVSHQAIVGHSLGTFIFLGSFVRMVGLDGLSESTQEGQRPANLHFFISPHPTSIPRHSPRASLLDEGRKR